MKPESSLPHSQVPVTCPYPEPHRSTPCSHIPLWISILILSSHLHLGLPGGLFRSGFPTKTMYMPLFSPIRFTWPAHLILDFYHPNTTWWRVELIKLLIMWFSPLPCYFFPLRPKYSQHTILKHARPTFLAQCELPSYTPTQNKRQNFTWGVQVLRSPNLFKRNYSPQEAESAVISQRNHPVDINIFHNAHATIAWPQQTLL